LLHSSSSYFHTSIFHPFQFTHLTPTPFPSIWTSLRASFLFLFLFLQNLFFSFSLFLLNYIPFNLQLRYGPSTIYTFTQMVIYIYIHIFKSISYISITHRN
jgi:hypothetical protein